MVVEIIITKLLLESHGLSHRLNSASSHALRWRHYHRHQSVHCMLMCTWYPVLRVMRERRAYFSEMSWFTAQSRSASFTGFLDSVYSMVTHVPSWATPLGWLARSSGEYGKHDTKPIHICSQQPVHRWTAQRHLFMLPMCLRKLERWTCACMKFYTCTYAKHCCDWNLTTSKVHVHTHNI